MTQKISETNNARINELAEMIAKLHLLDSQERSYINGSISALVFLKQLHKKENKDVS